MVKYSKCHYYSVDRKAAGSKLVTVHELFFSLRVFCSWGESSYEFKEIFFLPFQAHAQYLEIIIWWKYFLINLQSKVTFRHNHVNLQSSYGDMPC